MVSTGNRDGVLKAIGLAVVNFSQLEDTLKLGVLYLVIDRLSDNKALRLLIGSMTFFDALKTLDGLFRDAFPSSRSAVNAIFVDLEKLNGERNEHIHSVWSDGELDHQLRKSRDRIKRSGPETYLKNVGEAEVLEFAERVEQAANKFVVELLGPYILPRLDTLPP